MPREAEAALSERESYEAYVASLESCPGCGRVDEMDNIEGRTLCAACWLDEQAEADCCPDCGEIACGDWMLETFYGDEATG
jgi:hypothetical protein